MNTSEGRDQLMEEDLIEIGSVEHFFSKINVAVIDLKLPLSIGDRISIKGPATDFDQTVDSIQINRKNIPRAQAGQSIGVKLAQQAKERDVVYKKL
ncbi:MAG: translation elongation factor-like protein [Candidatus Bathyarchaeia archaeon]|jgi:translation elongation factor EF-Tu-like GTPase